MKYTLVVLGLVAGTGLVVGFAGCGDDAQEISDAGGDDATKPDTSGGLDAGRDAEAADAAEDRGDDGDAGESIDASIDGPFPDGAIDANGEAGGDGAAIDAGGDTGAEAGVEAGTDAGADAGSDAGEGGLPEAGADGGSDAGPGCGFAFADPTCEACMSTSCCTEMFGCASAGNQCVPFTLCLLQCAQTDFACQTGCSSAFPDFDPGFDDVLACVYTNCGAQCIVF